MRINAYLAKCALGSRRKVEQLIISGRIKINGKIATLSSQVESSDCVSFDNKEVTAAQNKYFLVYKPVGYTSTVDDPYAEKKVVDLVSEDGLFPVGRLDKDSEGLIILTNDGGFAQKLIHPSFSHEKEYLVIVKVPSKERSKHLEEALKFFKCGIRLDERKTQPAKIKLLSQEGDFATFKIILEEGMKRQIRRTFEKAKLTVVRLKRVRIASYDLGDLEPGETIEFTPKILD